MPSGEQIKQKTKPNAAFYGCLFYFFIEYFRPQEKYSFVKGLPLGKICAILFLILFLLEGRKLSIKNRIDKLILIYFFWLIICSITGIDLNASFQFLTNFGKLILIYFLTINTIDNRKRLFQLVFFICLLYFSFTNFAVRQWVESGFHVGFRGTFVGSGYFKNPNDMGCALATFFGISFYMVYADSGILFKRVKNKYFHIINTIFFIVGILVSGARLAAVGLAVSLVYIWAKNKFRIKYLVIGSVLVFAYIATLSPDQLQRFQDMGSKKDKTAQERIINWKIGLQMMNDFPVFGVGPGNYVEAKEYYYNEHKNLFVQHNIFLQASTELGYPGLFLLLLIFYSFYKKMFEIKKEIIAKDLTKSFYYLAQGLEVGTLGFMVSGFFITTLYYPFLWVNLMIAGALTNLIKRK